MTQITKNFIPAMGYDWLTRFYDITVKLVMPEKTFRTRLIDEIEPRNGERLLEFGFGTAQNLLMIKQRNSEVKLTGLDIDPKVRAIAAEKLVRAGYDIALDLYDGNVFPYQDNTFDKVFSSLVFHQLDIDAKLFCFKEIYRVLKPGGAIVIGDWGKPSSKWMRVAFYMVQWLDGFETTRDNVNGLMPELMTMAGFRQVEERGYINTKIGTYRYHIGTK